MVGPVTVLRICGKPMRLLWTATLKVLTVMQKEEKALLNVHKHLQCR